jgi:hypothetical protein
MDRSSVGLPEAGSGGACFSLPRKPLSASVVAGSVIWLDALLLRLLFQANEDVVYFLGRKLEWVCELRARYGLPCPTCGLTRSVILTLHGEIARASAVNPSGPVFAFGILAIGTALLLLPLFPRFSTTFRRAALAYSAAAVLFWLAEWVVRFRHYTHV